MYLAISQSEVQRTRGSRAREGTAGYYKQMIDRVLLARILAEYHRQLVVWRAGTHLVSRRSLGT